MSGKPITKFVCERWPGLRVRELQFQGGVLYAFTEEEADLIRNADGFDVEIKELPLEFESPQVRTGPEAHQGTQSAASSQRPESEEKRGTDEDSANRNVAAKGAAGWYKYRGKSYRKGDLPEGAVVLE